MQDFANSRYQSRKAPINKAKIQRKPLDLKKHLRPLGKIAAGVFVISLVCGAFYGIYRALSSTTFFKLKNIEVSSTKHMTREDILGLAGVEPGKDLLRMNLKRMGEHILQNPWVETVRINRFFPDGISISITEREPLAIVSMGFIYYLDKNATVFKALNHGDKLDYPVVTGFSEEELSNDPKGTTKEAIKSTCELLKILREKGAFILADVSEIHYDKGYGFTMFTASGALPVKIGSGEFAPKLDRFSKIYRDLMVHSSSLQYIDLDYNDKIIVKKS